MKKYTQLNTRNYKFKKAAKVKTFKMKIKKGDQVIVKTGKDKGKTGAVLTVFPAINKIVVEGVALHKRHFKKVRGQKAGSIVERAMPINASNVMIIDPKGDKPSRVKRVLKDGKLVRSTKSGTILA